MEIDDHEAFRDRMGPGYSRVQTELLDKYVRNRKVRKKFDSTYFDVPELLKLIDTAYVDVHEKLDSIRMMKDEIVYLRSVHPVRSLGPEDERDYDPLPYITVMEKAYNTAINLIYRASIKERSLFIVKYAKPPIDVYTDFDSPSDYLKVHHLCEEMIFDTIEDVERSLKDIYEPEYGIIEGDIKVITISDNKPHSEPLSFTIHYNGKDFNLFRVYFENKDHVLGLSDEEAGLLEYVVDLSQIQHEKLPYRNNSYIKVQTPLMKNPYIGRLSVNMDGFHNWYSFLEGIDRLQGVIDLSCHELDCWNVDYATWDWIEEASYEEVKEFLENGKKMEKKLRTAKRTFVRP